MPFCAGNLPPVTFHEQRIARVLAGPVIDMMEKCRCGHFRHEHHARMGCMRFDVRVPAGYCQCDGFRVRV
jgi:hypothetical protein